MSCAQTLAPQLSTGQAQQSLVFTQPEAVGAPGLILLIDGGVVSAILLFGPVRMGSITLDYHTSLYSTAAILLGYQAILLFIFAKLMAVETGLHPLRAKFWFLEQRRTLEQCVIIGGVLILVGVVLGIITARQWELTGFGSLRPESTIRFGGQTLLGGFYFGLINLVAERRRQRVSSSHPAVALKTTHSPNGGSK